MDEEETYTIAHAAKELKIPAHQIRRFCNASLIPGYQYRFRRHRAFTASEFNWLKTLAFLYRSGFSQKDLRKFLHLERSVSKKSQKEQREMILTHKRQIWQKMEDLRETLDYLERKEELLSN